MSAMKWTRSSRSAQSTAPESRWTVTRRIDPIEEFAELGHDDLPERRRESGAEILAELKPDGGPEVDRHQVARQDASDEPLLLDDERVDRLVEQRASPDQAGEPEPQPNEPTRRPGTRPR